MKKIATIVLAIAMVCVFAIGASASRLDLGSAYVEMDGADGFTIRTNGADDWENDLTTEMLTSYTYLVIACSPDADFDTGVGMIWGGPLGTGNTWWQQRDFDFADYYSNGEFRFPLADLNNYEGFLEHGGYIMDDGEPAVLKIMVRMWGAYDEIEAGAIWLDNGGGTPAAAVETPAETPAEQQGEAVVPVPQTVTPAGDKEGADTGIADVAVASAIAIVAAGAVVFSRRKK
jgi:hypothetical protein